MGNERPPTSAEWALAYLALNDQVHHVYRRGNHYIWDGRCYRQIEDQMMLAAISRFVQAVEPSLATAHLVVQIVETITHMAAIPSIPTEPIWLDGSPAANAIAFQNGVLNLDQFIAEGCREPALLPAP